MSRVVEEILWEGLWEVMMMVKIERIEFHSVALVKDPKDVVNPACLIKKDSDE